ncbi:MAG: hypothetical protein A2Y59_05410 [Chloroflexi bacterium RBG_13_52_14]|nr:MAG: hypothetical protein A2Y59_05410 [Chloroflexi bacterium RBG_13_52_14]
MKQLRILLAVVISLALIVGTIGCGGGETNGTTEASPTPITPITLKLVTSLPIGSTLYNAWFLFADLVESRTDGRVKIDIYPGGQLFPATQEFEAVVSGTVDIFADSTYYINEYVPDVMVFYIDGMWESYEQAYAALEDSELPNIFAEKVEAAAPVKMLGLFAGGINLCYINTVRETKSMKDLSGLKMQSSPGAPPMPVYTYTGATAVPISTQEAVVGFIQGVIDAMYYPPATLVQMGAHKTGKHVLYTTGSFAARTMIINEDSWDSLPTDIQDIINGVIPEVYEFIKTGSRAEEEAAIVLIDQNVETSHWVTAEELKAYHEVCLAHPVVKGLLGMVDPRIVKIVQDLKMPSS